MKTHQFTSASSRIRDCIVGKTQVDILKHQKSQTSILRFPIHVGENVET